MTCNQLLLHASIHYGLLFRSREGRGSVKQLPDQVFKQSKNKDFLEKLLIRELFETYLVHVSKDGKLLTNSFRAACKKKKKPS